VSSDWDEEIEAFVKLSSGRNEFDILAEPTIETNKWGKKQFVFPTSLGLWRVSNRSPIAAELGKYKQAHGSVAGVHVVLEREGEGPNTRYKLISVAPTSKPKEMPKRFLTEAEALKEAEGLPPEQKQRYLQYLRDTGQIKG